MFKFYRQSQRTQIEWIRRHPVQWIALNATIIAVGGAYMKHKERKYLSEIENGTAK